MPPHTTIIDADSRDLLDEFYVQADLSPLTLAKYRSQLEEWACWLAHPLAHIPDANARSVRCATARELQSFLGYLRTGERFAAAHPERATGPLSASSRKNYVASLRGLYRYLTAMRIIENDPTLAIRSPKIRTRPGFRLSQPELEQLLAAPGSARSRIVAFLLVFTAARANEIRTLRWSDIDLDGRTLLLHTKNDEYHTVDIHPRLMVELRRWHLLQADLADANPQLASALRDPNRAFVLLTRSGKPLAKGALAKDLKRRAAKIGLHRLEPAHHEQRSRVTPHAIRRSVASMLLNSGEPIDAVADVLHHRQLDTTRRHYAFASNRRRKATIESILR
jgi:integrase/recombinase XerD